jgi:formate-dependent nitrite reductase membrane component NrfD
MSANTDTPARAENRWNEVMPGPGSVDPAPSYYDISMLRAPVWTPEVGAYFFFGGLSGGAFMLARLAERIGGANYRRLTRAATYMAAATVLPCAPLLIKDLGDPKRFHHMLRVFKPGSPMNFGSWVLTLFTPITLLAALREALRRDTPLTGAAKAADNAVAAVIDAGVPLGLLLAGYTGVLLSTTSVPIWGRNPWLGAVFSAGAVSSAASAVHLALAGAGEPSDSPATEALQMVEHASHAAEVFTLAGYVLSAGEFAKPLTEGEQSKQFWGGAVIAGLAIPALLTHLPAPKKVRKWLGLAASALTVIGAFALRMSITEAGRESANDPEAARRASRRKSEGGIA